jgi:signal transduction histidine kinase
VNTGDTIGGQPSSLVPSAVLDPLWGHPLVVRLARAGRCLKQVDLDRPWVLDTLVVVGVVLLFCVPDLMHGGGPDGLVNPFARVPAAGMVVLQAGLVLPLLWRRRVPSAVFAAIGAVFVFQWSLGVWLRADVALLVALYSLALYGRLRHLLWACAVMAGALVLVAVRVSSVVSVAGAPLDALAEALFFLFSAATAALALGLAVRIRRSQLAVLRERAARLEVERDQRSKLAAAGERTRVAREMHDIVGHNLSVMITLADGGAYAADVTPERSTAALRLIAETGREALSELRRMLGVLREDAAAPELSPQPSIADIDALCTRIRAAGPQVVYRTTGDVDAPDRGVQLAVYRIAQEALTNALKHAGPATWATLTLNIEDTHLRIRVDDTGPPAGTEQSAPANQEGHGLAGMRERAALYGGAVLAGYRPGGGWTVQATLHFTPPPGSPGSAL